MIDRKRLATLTKSERDAFCAARPKSMALLERGRRSMPDGVPLQWMITNHDEHPPFFVAEAEGVYLTDVDGHRYLDTNLADMSMAAGYGIPAVAEAVERQFRKGAQYLLPTEETLEVTEEMARRFGKPYWQFTLAASNANSEAMRIARAMTGRDKILTFDGKYHGHLDITMYELRDGAKIPQGLGIPSNAGNNTMIVQFNDLEAIESILKQGEIACVLTEPAFTNVGGTLMPDDGFHEALRALTRRYGVLLLMDETHTHVSTFGGLTRAWELDSDILVMGKTLGGGIPVGCYGFTEEIKDFIERPGGEIPAHQINRVACGGTLFANALQFAAVNATLKHVLTEPAQRRTAELGERLADGIEEVLARYELPWSVWRLYIRSGFFCGPYLPRNNLELAARDDRELRKYLRIFMANRGIWDAITNAGPAMPIGSIGRDVDLYLEVFAEGMDSLLS